MCTVLQPQPRSTRISHQNCPKSSPPKRSFEQYTSYYCTSEHIHVQESTCCRCYAVLRRSSSTHGCRCPIGPSYDRHNGALVALPWQLPQRFKCLTKCFGLTRSLKPYAHRREQKWTKTSSVAKNKNQRKRAMCAQRKTMKNRTVTSEKERKLPQLFPR